MEEAEGNYSVDNPSNEFAPLEYSLDHPHSNQLLRARESPEDNMEMVDYMLHHPVPHHHPPPQPQLSLDKLSFADVMQFADFGPKLALNQSRISDEDNYFLKFPVLSGRLQDDHPVMEPHLPVSLPPPPSSHGEGIGTSFLMEERRGQELYEEEERRDSDQNVSSVQQQKRDSAEVKNKRKRPRSMKTTEEVEIQRMTHIAVERNRRKQMNEHLRVLRSLMPGSYVQRGDQASIIGGAIEFVRELEQLLQCLESQKRRRMYGGEGLRPPPDPQVPIQQAHLPPFFPSPPFPGNDQMKLLDYDATCDGAAGTLHEEAAESKSCLADVEVKLLGFDAMIKILSRRRPGQLLKAIAALEDLQLNILHTNITTIEQTVLYSFNVKISGETRFSAGDIANSVQQIFNFINASTM